MSGQYNLVPRRSEIKIGAPVKIIQKIHYDSGKITEGEVQQILTSKDDHPRGIKVRIKSGIVGRVQALGGQPIREVDPGASEVEGKRIDYIPNEDELL